MKHQLTHNYIFGISLPDLYELSTDDFLRRSKGLTGVYFAILPK